MIKCPIILKVIYFVYLSVELFLINLESFLVNHLSLPPTDLIFSIRFEKGSFSKAINSIPRPSSHPPNYRIRHLNISHNPPYPHPASQICHVFTNTKGRLRGGYRIPCHFEAVSLEELETQLPLLCALLPSVALRTTNTHTVCFLCCL